MATKTAASRRDLEARVIANAWRDPKYKKALLKDPKAVLESELRKIDPTISLPDTLKVQVHEEAADTFHLVLPRDPRDVKLSDVLSDDQLEAVAPQTIAVVTNGVGVCAVVTGPVTIAYPTNVVTCVVA
ncbi:MAG: hypothetical protein VR70_09970 [Rhodospirillaceae bacterium BRH_c57]|nr:MAG: hypothetical protein VR70_09970 [Rhodospirillaceae bacterium BRH_c57]